MGVDAGREPLGDLLQQEVAHGMAEGMVDDFETVQIQKNDSDQPAGCLGGQDRLSQPRVIKHARGQPGERIRRKRGIFPVVPANAGTQRLF